MTNDVAVSVIIPLYNRGEYIKRAIDSVLSQTYQNFEIIIIDDGSTDGSSDVVKRFPDTRIRLLSQENQGVSAARNKGAGNASSDFLAFLDADDEWLPDHLETLLRLRNKYPFAGAYTTAYKILEPDGKIRSARYNALLENQEEGIIPDFFKSAALGDSPLNSSSVGIPKIIFNEFGGFLSGVPMGEDTDLWIRIALKYRIAFSWEGEIIWHQEAKGRACNTLNLISLEQEPGVTRALAALNSNSVSPADAPFLKEFVENCELNRALWNIKVGETKKARDIVSECNTTLFIRKKISLTIFSYIPHPVFIFFWKTVRIVKQNLFKHNYSQDPWLK
jgi:glycosyltransferase involved in cell wall biosynthesis